MCESALSYQLLKLPAMSDLFTAANPHSLGMDSARLQRIRPWMERWVESGRLPFLQVLVMRRGQTAFYHHYGQADRERQFPVSTNTMARYYSMTKPLTTMAAMMLYEEGSFQLDDPLARYIPSFASMRVYTGGKGSGGSTIKIGLSSGGAPEAEQDLPTVEAERQITIRDLMNHTSGLTYGFMMATPVDALYRANGIDFANSTLTLAELTDKAASMPLLAHPGTQWNYSIATDVLGRLVEVVSGVPFETFMRERILQVLGMQDTDFFVPASKLGRFAANYVPSEGGLKLADDPRNSPFSKVPSAPSGGGGLVSCIGDYARFVLCLRNKGQANGQSLLSRKSVELMMSNHLNGDMAAMGQPRFSESNYEGIGFGLGFSVMLDPARAQILGSPGEVAWGGAASTAFWHDPAEDMSVIMATQLMPSSTYPIRRELRVLSYQALA
jgi:CubicO group peptidase (beta-lactamase class C family)